MREGGSKRVSKRVSEGGSEGGSEGVSKGVSECYICFNELKFSLIIKLDVLLFLILTT